MEDVRSTIFEALCQKDAAGTRRGYLGMSSIGRPCLRQSWFDWRQTSGYITDGRVLALFSLGNHVEQIVCSGLRLAGYRLTGAYPDEQLTFEDFGGFFSGHPDGVIDDSDGPMILEIKSANTNKFKAFGDKGVKEVYPAYFAQMQLYMHYSGLNRALFVVMKKDDSDIYTEIVRKDDTTAEEMRRRAVAILRTHEEDGRICMPDRIGDDPRGEECKWCRYTVACFNPKEAIQTIQTCRSCAYFSMGPDFKPSCGHQEHKFPLKNIGISCPQWCWVMRVPWR